MEKKEIAVSIDGEKLEALRYYLSKDKRTPEKELQDCFEKLYEQVVPADAREYIERKAYAPARSRPKRVGQSGVHPTDDTDTPS